MQIFFEIFRQEILILRRNSSKLLNNLAFFIMFEAVFFLLLQNYKGELCHENPAIAALDFLTSGTVLAILTSCLIYFGQFLRQDCEDGTIEQLMLACSNFEIVVLAKLLANWLCCCFMVIICSGIFALAISSNFVVACKFSIVIAFLSLILSCICAFCGSLASLCNSLALVAIIALPLAIPPLLIAHLAISEDFFGNMKILIAFALLAVCGSCFVTTKIIKIWQS